MQPVDEPNTFVVEGEVESVIYHNEGNGFTVFTLAPAPENPTGQLTLDESDVEPLTCTAYLASLNEGEMVKLSGNFVNNPRYGRQLSVSHAEKCVPRTPEGIEKYLGSGVIKGVGERTAKRIVEAFGEDTFEIIEDQPERLTQIRGINLEKAMRISETFHAQAALRRAMLFLQDFGISPAYAMKIYKQYKENTVDIVKGDPYRLADDIDGIGFKTADGIAWRVGIEQDADARISAGIRFCLWEAANNGHTYLPENVLLEQARALLNVETERIAGRLSHMQINRLIHRETPHDEDSADTDGTPERRVFLSAFYHAEMNVARKLSELAYEAERAQTGGGARMRRDTEQAVLALEREADIHLSEGQREAVVSSVVSGVLVITGGPGTGKTTAINTIIGLLSARGLRIELTAPTGRAAKRMTEATGREAKTIHRLLETSFIAEDARKQTFQRNEDNPLETDVLIVDEISMTDILLMQSLLRAVVPGTRLVLVGDVDQLPSVGPGNVLKDLIASERLTVVRLTEIFRQAQESAIIMNAHRINRGEYPVLNEKNADFFFLRRSHAEDVATALVELVTKRLPRYLDGDMLQDIQILTPMRKSALGVTNLNRILQQHINPPAPGKKEREFRSVVFREGDKVMQIKNNYSLSWKVYDTAGHRTDEGEGVFNGDGGIIRDIDEDSETVTVRFDDNRQADYDFSQLDELELAYAVTIHKSQGSEYRAVVIPLHSGPPMLMSRNLLYTAVTRARELAVIVGVPETLYRMVDNNRELNRYTALTRRIRMMFDLNDASQRPFTP